MQNTRLNRIPSSMIRLINQWLANPWRNLSLHIICWLLGFVIGITIATYSGQQGIWDFSAAALVIITIEGISWFHYRPGQRSPIVKVLHSGKLGLTYNLILEAFKLGS